MTVWKSLEGFPDYEISSSGEVRSWKPLRNFSPVPDTPRVLKHSLDKDGYKRVVLYKDNRPTYHRICRLVCSTFNGSPKDNQQVRHLDGNNQNDHFENLCWGSSKENSQDKIPHGTLIHGTMVNTNKLSKEEVFFIRESIENSKTLANKFNVSLSLIYKIKSKEIWKHV